jgi:TonB family protein
MAQALSLGALALLLLLGKDCGHEQRQPPQAAVPPPRIDPATLPDIPVHPESLRGVDEARIYHQLGGGGAPPRLIARKDIEYPPDHRPWGGQPGVLIVEAVIPRDGRIARIKVLKGPQDEILNRALVAALKEWRFVPAKLHGEAVPVYYVLAIPVNEKKSES